MRSVEEIQAELNAAKKVEEAERQARRDAVKPIWQFTILPVKADYWDDELYDNTVVAYRLSGEILNRDECLAVGHAEHSLSTGAMRYLFNTGTHRLIGATGGGTIYLSTGFGNNKAAAKAAQKAVIDGINKFLTENPEGGDISGLVNEFRKQVRS